MTYSLNSASVIFGIIFILTLGIPTVKYCADRLCMSPNYFGDVIKKATGDTASNYIRYHIIQQARNRLASGASIAQVAYSLGFEYPQHFSRMFKKQTGTSPTQYMSDLKKEKKTNPESKNFWEICIGLHY